MKSKHPKQSVDFALRQLLVDGEVSTHDEICTALNQQGYNINQTKVSRLLHKIGAIKVINAEGRSIYRLPHEHGLMHEIMQPVVRQSVKDWVIDVGHNTMMIVVHTTPGAAALVAREIDLHQVEFGILGSIAGDDTIFIAPKEPRRIKQIIELIKNKL